MRPVKLRPPPPYRPPAERERTTMPAFVVDPEKFLDFVERMKHGRVWPAHHCDQLPTCGTSIPD